MDVIAFLQFCAYAALCTACFTGSQALFAIICGVRLEEIQLFYGRRLVTVVVHQVKVSVGWIPTGSFAKFRTRASSADELMPRSSIPTDTFDDVHPIARAFIILSGPISLLVLACTLSPPRNVAAEAVETFGQFWEGARHPFVVGPELIGRALKFIGDSTVAIGLSTVAAKFAAINSIPIPLFAGGQALFTLIQWKRTDYEKYVKQQVGVSLIGVVVLSAFLVGWALAIGTFVIRQLGF
ncbi:MAG TPA: site-2 protease family protein [Phycisphaerae bacterium]|nr:site-2 protease family protein [Phycisphaerae bacterium]